MDIYKILIKDIALQEPILKEHIIFIIQIAKKYEQYMNILDLIQEGYIGLIEASKKFKPELGSFKTYAKIYIVRFIIDAIGNDRLIQIPKNYRELKSKINKNQNETVEQIAIRLNVSKKIIENTLSMYQYVENIDEVFDFTFNSTNSDSDFDLHDREKQRVRKIIEKYFNILSDRDRYIILKYFNWNDECETSLFLAEKFQMTQMGVYLVIKRSLKKILKTMKLEEVKICKDYIKFYC